MPHDSQTPPNTDNYAIGKGVLSISNYVSGQSPSWTEMGNCPSIEVEPMVERTPHYSSQSGYKTKDKNPATSTDYTVNFDCDEIATANLRKYLMGTTGSHSHEIYALQAADEEYALKFVSDNPTGPNYTWTFHRCTIQSNGAMALIGEDWIAMSFTAEGLSDSTNNASSPYFDVEGHTTTTTSSTSSTTN